MVVPEHVSIEVAGVGFRFAGDAASLGLVRRRYGRFVTADARGLCDPTAVDLDLHEPAGRPVVDEALVVEATAAGFALRGSGVRAEFGPELEQVALRGPRAERPVDAVVRIVLAGRLLHESAGLLAHASAVVIDGAAWVFAGPSGVGKSTLGATLSGELLCDEAVAVTPAAPTAPAIAHSTPYWRARPGSAPIRGLLFPTRGPRAWRTLSAGAAAARLLSSVGPLLPGATPVAFAACARLAQSLDCAEIAMESVDEIRSWLEPRLAEKTRSAPPTSPARGRHQRGTVNE